jgi:hypothetical protein
MFAKGVSGGKTMLNTPVSLNQRNRQIQPLPLGMLPSDKGETERHLHQFHWVSRVDNKCLSAAERSNL